MEKVKRILKSKKGSLFVEKIITLIVIIAVSFGVIQLIVLLQQKKTLDNMAIELTRCIQLNGQVTEDFTTMYDSLSDNMDVKPTYDLDTKYLYDDKIQLGTTIILKLEQETSVFAIPLTIKSKGAGNSEVYFKAK